MFDLIMKFYHAFRNSWHGMQYAWRDQWAFRVEIVILILALPFVFIFGHDVTQYALMISSLVLLLMMELVNSAIETTVNRIGREHNELSGLAKDLASAAMVAVGINVLVIWGFIFFGWLQAMLL